MEGSAVAGPFVRRYHGCLESAKYIIIVFWLVMLGFGVWIGPKLLGQTSLSFSAPKGSEAAVAYEAVLRYFPEQDGELTIMLIQSNSTAHPVINPYTQRFVERFSETTAAFAPCANLAILDYYSMAARNLSAFAEQTFVSHEPGYENKATIVTINNNYVGGDAQRCVSHMQNASDVLAAQLLAPHGLLAQLTGNDVFARDVQAGTERDLLVMDGIALPLAFVLLAVMLRSARLLLLPLACMAVSIMTSFMLFYPVALHTTVISFAPSVMMSVTLAMSVDYSLFLCSRFREELEKGATVGSATLIMLASSGTTITVSGGILALSFLCLMIFPLPLLSSMGAGAALAVTILLIVNLTLIPALVMTFPRFFGNCTGNLLPAWCSRFCCCSGGDGAGRDEDGDLEERSALLTNAVRSGSLGGSGKVGLDEVEVERARLSASRWYRFAQLITSRPYIAVLLVVALCVPFGYFAIGFKKSSSITMFTPRGSDATKAYETLGEAFGTGSLYPFTLLVVPPPAYNGVLNATFFDRTRAVLERDLTISPGSTPKSFLGPMYVGGLPIEEPGFRNCLFNTSFPGYDQPICMEMRYLRNYTITADASACFVQIRLVDGVDPFGPDGAAWVDRARENLKRARAETNFTMLLSGNAVSNHDTMAEVYSAFPTAIGVTGALVLLIMAVSFRSLFQALRSVFSILLTVAFVYGSAVFVFQYGSLDWLTFKGVASSGALNWIAPVMCFNIIVGLSVDYDCFGMSRIYEYRCEGKSTHDAVLMGMTRTGSIITAAGCVMAVAFVGLSFSSEPVLNQLAFFMVVSVLFDTFVTRTFFVPALTAWVGEVNWFPKKMPIPKEGLLL